MILLTNEQIKEITELQRILDERIRENNGIDKEKSLGLEKYIALKTEFFEFVNEIESFKFWKKNKGKENIVEEACDTLHFILSLAIENEHEIVLGDEEELFKDFDKDNYDINELIGIVDTMMTDLAVTGEPENLDNILIFLCVILNKCNFNGNDLYEAYISKNKVNHKRQDTNY